MPSSFPRFVAAIGVVLCGMFAVPAAWGEGYPNSPTGIVVTTAAAGFTDALARIAGQALSANIGQAVIVGNKPEEYGEHIKAEIAKWTKVVKVSGTEPE